MVYFFALNVLTNTQNAYIIISAIRETHNKGGDNMFPNIRAELARNNLTMSRLAEILKVDRKTLGKWIKDGCIPAHALITMSSLFNVSVDYLLGRE